MTDASRSKYGLLPQDDLSLLSRIEHRDDFGTGKWRCLLHPDSAVDTLGPYARLELCIVRARDLMVRPAGLLDLGAPTTNALVQVDLDDRTVPHCKTPLVTCSAEPAWDFSCEVDIVSPLSMLRLQVVDEQTHRSRLIGFVELCVGDLPYDTPVEGWLELRFQENLQRTSGQRFASHSKMREDDFHKKVVAAYQHGRGRTDLEEGAAAIDLFRKHHAERSAGMLGSCVTCAKGTPDQGDPSSHAKGTDEVGERMNAGEIYVSLQLRKVVSSLDSLFALALTAPVPKDFGSYIQVENLPHVDLQFLYDQAWEFKVRLVDDALLCVWYYFRFVCQWRNPVLSLTITASLLVCCWHNYLAWVALPALLAGLLALNSHTAVRLDMTRGGLNAPLTQDGFRRVAKCMSSDEMYRFVKRLVEDDIHGSIKDTQQVRSIASRCFRDGVPTLTLDELRLTLRTNESVHVETGGSEDLRKGDLVLVDERDRAVVVSPGDSHEFVLLAFEVRDALPRKLAAKSIPVDRIETVERRRVRKRAVLSSVAQWLLPRVVDNWVRTLFPMIQDSKHHLVPLVDTATSVLTWHWPFVSSAAVVGLLSLAVLNLLLVIEDSLHLLPGDSLLVSQFAVLVFRSLDNVVMGAVLFWVLIYHSTWFMGFQSVLRILLSLLSHRRRAPACWAFFRSGAPPGQDAAVHGRPTPAEAEQTPAGNEDAPPV